ncbi:MAG: imidazole glycerol phosphate synthase subunit HisF, partial [Terriglobales bacterium]
MLTKRIIACLDCHAGRVMKGVKFVNLRDAGDPAELARLHAENGADEIVLLDITATHEARKTLVDTVRRTARELFVPFTVGGGIRSLDDAAAVFDAGCDKITINSAAVADPGVITAIANRFGSQAVVLAIDAKRRASLTADRTWKPGPTLGRPVEHSTVTSAMISAEVYVSGGRNPTGLDAIEWAKEVEACGAGEIMLTSMDRDGTRAGFDCKLTAAIASAVSIPVIASGGAGSVEHFVEVFRD